MLRKCIYESFHIIANPPLLWWFPVKLVKVQILIVDEKYFHWKSVRCPKLTHGV